MQVTWKILISRAVPDLRFWKFWACLTFLLDSSRFVARWFHCAPWDMQLSRQCFLTVGARTPTDGRSLFEVRETFLVFYYTVSGINVRHVNGLSFWKVCGNRKKLNPLVYKFIVCICSMHFSHFQKFRSIVRSELSLLTGDDGASGI